MKKINVFYLVAAILFAAIFVSCEKDDSGINSEKMEVAETVSVDMNVRLPQVGDNSTSLKSANLDPVASGVPVFVKWLSTVSQSSACPTGVSQLWEFTPGSGIVADFRLNGIFVGLNTITGETGAYVEGEVPGSTDPQASENDGVSTGGSTNEAPFPNLGRSLTSDEILDALGSLYPYVTFSGEVIDHNVTKINPNPIYMELEANQGRMSMTFEFCDAPGCPSLNNYYAVVKFNDWVSMGGNSPSREFGVDLNNPVAWFYWSNELATGGKIVDFQVSIYEINNNTLLHTLYLSPEDIVAATIKDGKDTRTKIIITDDMLYAEPVDATFNFQWAIEEYVVIFGSKINALLCGAISSYVLPIETMLYWYNDTDLAQDFVQATSLTCMNAETDDLGFVRLDNNTDLAVVFVVNVGGTETEFTIEARTSSIEEVGVGDVTITVDGTQIFSGSTI